MDLQNLKNNYSLLLSYMEQQNYGRQYIKFIEKQIHWIINESENYGWKSYDDIHQTYVKQWKNKHTLANRCRGLLIIRRFDLEAQMPDGSKHYHKPSSCDFLCGEFKDFIDLYRKVVLSKDSRKYYKGIEYSTCSFLLQLQNNGIDSFGSLTERDVWDVFSCKGTICKSHTFKTAIATAFKTCLPFYKGGIYMKITTYLPVLPRINKNIQYLTKEEVHRIKSVLEEDVSLSLQNKAICLLAFYTGMRSSDICSLTLDNIDWDRDLIHIRQQKTGNPLTLPLRAVVGNAIFDYITKERPNTTSETVFLTVNAPYRRLHSSNLNAICGIVMRKAGVRNNPGDRKGMHLFRHHLATSLMGQGVEQPVISSTLGHRSPRSLAPYLSADFPHLKDRALSIEHFPVRKEVFQ